MAAIASNGTGGGVWSAVGTWNGGVVPGEGDTSTILNGDTVTIDGDITVGADTATAAINVAAGGILQVLNTVAADYTLIAKANISVFGTFNIGTVANPIPKERIFTLKLNYSAALADGKYGLTTASGSVLTIQGAVDRITVDRAMLAADNGGTCSTAAIGNVVTRLGGTAFTGKSGVMTILGVDYTISSITDADHLVLTGSAGNQTAVSFVFQSDNNALTTDVSTGWKDNDVIAIASTDRTYTHCEAALLNGDAVGTAVTIDGGVGSDGGLEWGHMGTSPTQAELINLTRNVVITAHTGASVTYVTLDNNATVDIDWAEFSYLGEAATGKRGLDIATATASCNVNYCSIHDCEDGAVYFYGSVDNVTLTYLVIYNVTVGKAIDSSSTTSGATMVMTNVIVMLSKGYSFDIKYTDWTLTNITVVGGGNQGFAFEMGAGSLTASGLVAHSCSSAGAWWNSQFAGATLTTVTIWRCNGGGLKLNCLMAEVLLDTWVLFGNMTPSIVLSGAGHDARFLGFEVNGDSVFATTVGVQMAVNTSVEGIVFHNCNFSVVSGIKTAHTRDLGLAGVGGHLYLENCKLDAATDVYDQATLRSVASGVYSQKHGQTAGNHKTWLRYGTISTDAVIFDVTPSARGTPIHATGKLEIPVGQVCVNSGETATVSAKVRKSVAGDAGGFEYAGSEPRLVVKRNVAAGVANDVVLDTMTAANGDWETLTGTTPAITDDAVLELVVDTDGTSGAWINCDTATVA